MLARASLVVIHRLDKRRLIHAGDLRIVTRTLTVGAVTACALRRLWAPAAASPAAIATPEDVIKNTDAINTQRIFIVSILHSSHGSWFYVLAVANI